MRITLDLPKDLIEQVMAITGAKTIQESIIIALEECIK